MLRLRSLVAPLCLAGLVALPVGCAAADPQAGSGSSDLVDPNHSNIASPELGTITSLKLVPSTNVPRAVLVGLMSDNSNERFVADLHDIVRTINTAEGLTGADGYEQQINLIVTTNAQSYATLLGTLRGRMGLAADAAVPLVDLLERVAVQNDPWLQDFGEFAAVQGTARPGQTWYGLLDGGRGRGLDVGALGGKLGLPITTIDRSGIAGDYGGNTEATPEGTLYIGDSAAPAYIAGLKALGNADAVVLPSSWLAVGHVDEYLQVVPARNACGAALMVSSSLEALNMVRRTPSAYPNFDAWNLGAGMDEVAVHRRPANEDYQMSDFDLAATSSSPGGQMVLLNLKAEQAEQTAIARLSAASCVGQQVIRLPQLYWHREGGAIAATPGTVNSLVLRNHVVVPDPGIDELREVVRARYAQATGSATNVHFIDDRFYHDADGEVHCGTNVIRELSMPYRF